jgi:hypothetical protein
MAVLFLVTWPHAAGQIGIKNQGAGARACGDGGSGGCGNMYTGGTEPVCGMEPVCGAEPVCGTEPVLAVEPRAAA